MRSIFVLAILLVAVSSTHAQDDAKKLFDEMEQRLAKAKSQKFDFECEASNDRLTKLTLKGSVLWSKDNKVKFDFDGDSGTNKSHVTWVCNGETLAVQTKIGDKVTGMNRPASAKVGEYTIGTIARASAFSAMSSMTRKDPSDPGKTKAISFKKLDDEKVDGKLAHVLEYAFSTPQGNTLKGKLWLDAKTKLPVKRHVEIYVDDNVQSRITETYSNWMLNVDLPKDAFALPN
ncbi:MAG TPA: DUF2092 domain-containing protein [Gemmataceae bacterium]|nr:DUF2092 domain-containing protein [Gemmataceae bacterium]